jgi:hypothetical protein
LIQAQQRLAFDFSHFHRQHGIRASRQRCARHDPHCLARGDFAVERLAR